MAQFSPRYWTHHRVSSSGLRPDGLRPQKTKACDFNLTEGENNDGSTNETNRNRRQDTGKPHTYAQTEGTDRSLIATGSTMHIVDLVNRKVKR